MAAAARSIPGEVRAALKLRDAERQRLSRALHDDAGPLLCAAGMAAELLRDALPAPAPQQEELFSRLSAALERAVRAVRVLSQEAAPGLASRRGLEGALSLLAEAHGAELRVAGVREMPESAQADALCDLARDTLLTLGKRGSTITLSPQGLSIAGLYPADEELESLLRSLAAQAGLTFAQRRSGEEALVEIFLGERG